MHFITHLGDMAVLVPLSLLLGIVLWRFESKAAARAFVAPLLVCLIAMFIFKLYFLSCGENMIANVASPSGHAAASTFVLGSIGIVIATHAPQWARMLILIAIPSLIVAITYSRIYIGAHTVAEVFIALGVGAPALMFFALRYSRLSHPRINFLLLASGVIILTALLYGLQLPAETLIKKWAHLIRIQSSACTAIRSVTWSEFKL